MDYKIVVTGIGTDVGKTVVSAILAEALKASYWKPVQAGDLDQGDALTVNQLTDNVKIIPEAFRLTQPMSPHAAARRDGVKIHVYDLDYPSIDGNLVIEGAGGLMVPINSDGLTYLDVFKAWKIPIVVVSKHYLGSINHTLLTVEALKSVELEIIGIVFVGEENVDTESIILKKTGLKMIMRVPWTDQLDKKFIAEQADYPGIKYTFL